MCLLRQRADWNNKGNFFHVSVICGTRSGITVKRRFQNRREIEVGGRKKSFEQIKDEENSYLAIDSIEAGNGNRIPLWLFGFIG